MSREEPAHQFRGRYAIDAFDQRRGAQVQRLLFRTRQGSRKRVGHDAVQTLIDEQGFYIMPPIPFADQTPNVELGIPYPAAPNSQNWLGTDDLGRDVLARILYGLRVSLLFGIALTLVGALIGIAARDLVLNGVLGCRHLEFLRWRLGSTM